MYVVMQQKHLFGNKKNLIFAQSSNSFVHVFDFLEMSHFSKTSALTCYVLNDGLSVQPLWHPSSKSSNLE